MVFRILAISFVACSTQSTPQPSSILGRPFNRLFWCLKTGRLVGDFIFQRLHFSSPYCTARAAWGARKKSGWGVPPGRPQSFRYQRRPVGDCGPGRGGMAQDRGTRGGTFHGEMDRCRESQGWTMTTACSVNSMPERGEKDRGENGPKQACSCWFARHNSSATGGANLYPPGVFFGLQMSCCLFLALRLLCFVSFSSFCFH